MRLSLTTRPVEKCRRQIDRFRQHLDLRTAGRVRFRPRIGDDQRNAHHLLVEEILFAEPVVAKIIAVIAGDDDVVLSAMPRLSRS